MSLYFVSVFHTFVHNDISTFFQSLQADYSALLERAYLIELKNEEQQSQLVKGAELAQTMRHVEETRDGLQRAVAELRSELNATQVCFFSAAIDCTFRLFCVPECHTDSPW